MKQKLAERRADFKNNKNLVESEGGDDIRRLLKKKSKNKKSEGVTQSYSPFGLEDPYDELNKQSMSKENLFFFTDQDFFRSTRYEYIGGKEDKKGFVFALVHPDNTEGGNGVSELKDTFLNSYASDKGQSLNPLTSAATVTARRYRVLKNLGSRVLNVKPYQSKSQSGFYVNYTEGDQCMADPSRRYHSYINYECDPDGHSKLVDYPAVLHSKDECNFEFVWRSRFACSICHVEQVVLHEEFCGKDGTSRVHVERKQGAQCVLDFVPQTLEDDGYLDHEFSGVYERKGIKYVSKHSFMRKCSVLSDISDHSFLNFIRDCLAVTFTIVILGIVCTYGKYA